MVNWGRGPWYMCILLYVKLLWCSSIPYIYGWLEEGTSALSICAFCYMWNVFGVVVFHTSMVNWSGGTSALSICAFCYMLNIFGVVLFQRYMINWGRGPWYMCILLCVKLIWYSSLPYIYGWFKEGTSALSICAFCYMWNLFSVVVFHTSMVNWRRGDLGIWALCYMWNFFL